MIISKQKRYLLNFIVSSTTFDGEKLIFNLKEPFNALLNSNKQSNWLPLPALLRQKYYRYVVEFSREIEIAKSYLQNPLGQVNGEALSS
jgi:hypothetical protein